MKKKTTLLGLCVAVVLTFLVLKADPAAQDGVEAFSTDITARQTAVGPDGRSVPIGERTFHFERLRKRGRWVTQFTIMPLAARTDLAKGLYADLPSALDGARIEDDGSGAFVVTDASGREMKMPDIGLVKDRLLKSMRGPIDTRRPADLQPPAGRRPGRSETPGAGWLRGTVLRMEQGPQRLAALGRYHRREAGTVRGSLRFVANDGEETIELLVEPNAGVVLESNMLERGRLIAHSTYSYQPEATGRLFRMKSRTERLASDGRSRTVFELELKNIRFGAAGGGR